jgi:hypothetical protein
MEQSRINGKLGGRGHVRKPDPMKTPRLTQGCGDKQADSMSIAKADAAKPNPMNGCEKLTFERADNLTKPVLLSDKGGNVTVRVQCRDCANISAGFKCLVINSGQTYPAMGEWRCCSRHVKVAY